MTCTCHHRQLSHRYSPAARANTGACLSPGCECGGFVGVESATFASVARDLSVGIDGKIGAPSQCHLTRGERPHPTKEL